MKTEVSTMNENKQYVIEEINCRIGRRKLEEIRREHGGSLRYPVYMSAALMDAEIEDLDLSVRAFNCLKRAGCSKVGDLIERIEGKQDLLKIRNLGNRSADEIMTQIMLFQYQLLKPEKQKKYLERIVELNA